MQQIEGDKLRLGRVPAGERGVKGEEIADAVGRASPPRRR
jgi:hypothetical protein